MASPEGCRDAQLGVPRPGRVAPGTRSRRRAPPTEASSGPFLLCTGRVEAEGNLNLFAQRSVAQARLHGGRERAAVRFGGGPFRISSEYRRAAKIGDPRRLRAS